MVFNGIALDEEEMRELEDFGDLARQLRAWAVMPLKRIIVSHGETIDSDPQGALLALAATLD